jgi:hypothetical protein
MKKLITIALMAISIFASAQKTKFYIDNHYSISSPMGIYALKSINDGGNYALNGSYLRSELGFYLTNNFKLGLTFGSLKNKVDNISKFDDLSIYWTDENTTLESVQSDAPYINSNIGLSFTNIFKITKILDFKINCGLGISTLTKPKHEYVVWHNYEYYNINVTEYSTKHRSFYYETGLGFNFNLSPNSCISLDFSLFNSSHNEVPYILKQDIDGVVYADEIRYETIKPLNINAGIGFQYRF